MGAMRMIHYFGAAAFLTIVALLASAWLGISGQLEVHFRVALVTAILAIGTHSLLILFMIITGRIIREAILHRDLPPEFLVELNQFFRRKKAYPAALLGAVSIVVAGVLGTAQSALGLPPMTHMLAGVLALCVNFFAIVVETQAIFANQELVDRVAATLDEIDRELEQKGNPPADDEPDPRAKSRAAMAVCLGAWVPYLYWGLVVWRGDFSKVSLHPWLEFSIAGFLVWGLARTTLESVLQEETTDS
jgi:hypothetical protein